MHFTIKLTVVVSLSLSFLQDTVRTLLLSTSVTKH